MKTISSETLDTHMKDFMNHRQDVPAHVQLQLRTKLRTQQKEERESNLWAGIMVLCSALCMAMLGWLGWAFFGQAALWAMGAVYYFLTMGGMVVMLLSSHTSRNKQIHQIGGI